MKIWRTITLTAICLLALNTSIASEGSSHGKMPAYAEDPALSVESTVVVEAPLETTDPVGNILSITGELIATAAKAMTGNESDAGAKIFVLLNELKVQVKKAFSSATRSLETSGLSAKMEQLGVTLQKKLSLLSFTPSDDEEQ